jgi:hypothetical protein
MAMGGTRRVQLLVVVLVLAFFFAYPTWGISQRRISLRGVTVELDRTPWTFWCTVGFLYFSGVALPCIMWQVPHSGAFLPIMVLFLTVYVAIYYLKW